MTNALVLRALARAFVDFVDQRNRLTRKAMKSLLKKDNDMLLAVLAAAGFKAYRLQRGNTNRHPYAYLCPFIVVRRNGRVNEFASHWLFSLIALVIRDMHYNPSTGRSDPGDDMRESDERVSIEIARSAPLVPICFTVDGDTLREERPRPKNDYNYFIDHPRDETRLNRSHVGRHAYCKGILRWRRVTRGQKALVCGECHLHVRFPTKVTTYGELREYFAEVLKT